MICRSKHLFCDNEYKIFLNNKAMMIGKVNNLIWVVRVRNKLNIIYHSNCQQQLNGSFPITTYLKDFNLYTNQDGKQCFSKTNNVWYWERILMEG